MMIFLYISLMDNEIFTCPNGIFTHLGRWTDFFYLWPEPELTNCQSQLQKQTSVKFKLKCDSFHWRNAFGDVFHKILANLSKLWFVKEAYWLLKHMF